MPRKPRFILPGVPLHVVQRGHNRADVFFDDEDRRAYLSWLGEAAERYRCHVHAYVLMTNHVHVLLTPHDRQGPSRCMQYVGRRYVPYANGRYRMSGTLWEGRFRASLVDDEAYLFHCMRYIELNPVRAGLVRTPAHYRWSSYRSNAQGKIDPLITPHSLFVALAANAPDRHAAYRALFADRLAAMQEAAIAAALHSGTPLGRESFIAGVEKRLHQKVGYARRGRPPVRSDELNRKGL